MNTKIKNNSKGILILILGLLFATMSTYAVGVSVVGWGGNYHSHGGGYGYGYGNRGYYNGGGIFFGWGGPDVIINVPVEPYYYAPPVCQNVEVCNPYDECWLERHCA